MDLNVKILPFADIIHTELLIIPDQVGNLKCLVICKRMIVLFVPYKHLDNLQSKYWLTLRF